VTSDKGAGALRKAALERAALAAGEQWASSYRDQVRGQGRAIAGGWPGTLSEARTRVAGACLLVHFRKTWADVSSAELDWLAKAAYAKAKHDWLAVADRDEA
jgi:hypothetical protein